MKNPKTLEEKLIDAGCIADAISALSFCLANTDANLECENLAHDVFYAFEKLGEALGNELTEISIALDKEGVLYE